jgi:signal transduction histidine kinase
MGQLKVLLVEDSEHDAALVLRELKRAGYTVVHKRVETAAEMAAALDSESWQLVLCDHSMPEFNGLDALELLRRKDPDLPFIIVSGQIGEDLAVEAVKAGANDYIMKGNLKRLATAVQREIREAEVRREREKVENELRDKQEELRFARQVEALKDEFIGLISHELRTPLTVISGSLRTIAGENLPPEDVKELLQNAIEGTDQLEALLENMLELSRHQAGRLKLSVEPVSVAVVARGVIKKLKDQRVSQRFSLDVPPGLPPVEADPVRVERILYNLLENAAKYSPAASRISVSACTAGDLVITSVADEGPGIPAGDQGHLFEVFQQLGNLPQQRAGAGLGLVVCKRLVEAQKGWIKVDSAPGKGAVFSFALPACTAGAG